jgi:hypothetical protein
MAKKNAEKLRRNTSRLVIWKRRGERGSQQAECSTDWKEPLPRDFANWTKLAHEEKTKIAS